MNQRNNLLVAASGTGGHIFPALAVSKKNRRILEYSLVRYSTKT